MNRKRNENENYEEYKNKLREDEKKMRIYLKGKLFWHDVQGTYRLEQKLI